MAGFLPVLPIPPNPPLTDAPRPDIQDRAHWAGRGLGDLASRAAVQRGERQVPSTGQVELGVGAVSLPSRANQAGRGDIEARVAAAMGLPKGRMAPSHSAGSSPRHAGAPPRPTGCACLSAA